MKPRRLISVAIIVLLLAGAGWAGEWNKSGVSERPAMYDTEIKFCVIRPSGVTNMSVADMFLRLHFEYIHFRHPWPVRWYDAAVKWLKAHLWWPVGEAEAGEKPSLFEATIEDDADLANVIGRVKKEHPDCVTVSWSYDTEIRPDDVLYAFQGINYVRSGSATSDKTRMHSDDFVTLERWRIGAERTGGEGDWHTLPWTDGRVRITGSIEDPPESATTWPPPPRYTGSWHIMKAYPQLTCVPWDEVNEFLRTEMKEGRVWEYADSFLVTKGFHFYPNEEKNFQCQEQCGFPSGSGVPDDSHWRCYDNCMNKKEFRQGVHVILKREVRE